MHGVTHTIEQIRERGVPGFEVEVIGTDAGVDRRLPAAAELEIPFYRGMRLGVPSLPDLVEALAEGATTSSTSPPRGRPGSPRPCSAGSPGCPCSPATTPSSPPTPACAAATRASRRSPRLPSAPSTASRPVLLSPSPAADRSLLGLGAEASRFGRWERGVDTSRFEPGKAGATPTRASSRVLYAGRLTREKGVDLLAESFLRARRADPRLHLLLAGGGPEEGELRARLGDAATFLGWLDGEELARAYASADVFLFCSHTDTYGQVILEAGASGLAAIAVAEGGPAALIENRHTGMLCRPDR